MAENDDPYAHLDARSATTGTDPYADVDKTPAPRQEQAWIPYLAQKADDAVRAAANTVTFGLADRMAGVANVATGLSDARTYGEAVDEEVKKSTEARERSPYVSTGADVGSIVATAPVAGGAQIATRAVPYLGRLGARALGYGVEGGVLGAAQGAGNTYTGEAGDYLKNAGMGGVLGFGTGAVTGGAFGPRGTPQVSSATTPLASELRNVSDAQYKTLRTLPTEYETAPIAQRAADMTKKLLNDGVHPGNAPETFRALGQLQIPVAFHAPGTLEGIRQGLNKISKGVDSATDRGASYEVKNMIHDMIANPQGVLPGTERAAAEAGGIVSSARGNWAAAKRAEQTGGMLENARNTAGSTFSGLNYEAPIRQGARSLLNPLSPAARGKVMGWNADEMAALRDIANPSLPSKAVRYAGNIMGGGGGIAAPVAGAAVGQYFKDNPVLGGALGTAVPVAGLGLRLLSNRNARVSMEALDTMMRQRSPLYQSRAATAPMMPAPGSRVPAAARDAIALELLRNQMPQEQQDAP